MLNGLLKKLVKNQNIDAEESAHTELPVDVARYDKGTHRTPTYIMTMDMNVENIDINDNNTWRIIYEAIDELFFEEVRMFPKEFQEHCKKEPKHVTEYSIRKREKKQLL